ncbi:4-phosphoerythronate dehydrogenase [Idiomarina seosinensis]|uniref:4-phosphoerythronate dehydrogenase n=1 Tax=Idiomarina seosinensis TaxID=281739 RepID=UPI00384D09B5
MHIVADQNIPALPQLLAGAGRLSRYSERQPPAQLLRTADALLVRSVTTVDRALLRQAPQLKFVGTATIGTEHLHCEALAERDIAVASAPGANADSVGEFVLAAVLACFQQRGQLSHLPELEVAIVGAGHTGRAAGQRLQALGLLVHYYDPPLLKNKNQPPVEGELHNHWQRVLNSDIISCHVPLTHNGPHPTAQLLDIEALQSLHNEQLLINASRGAVVDNQALLRCCQQGDCPQLVLDVWQNEPQIITELLPEVTVATPHIAGHSAEGKLGGAIMIARALQQFAGQPFSTDLDSLLPPCDWPVCDAEKLDTPMQLAQLVLQRYDIWQDDRNMRERGTSAAGFDQLRKQYRKDNPRRQLNNQRIACHNSQQLERFRALGFSAFRI